MTSQNRRDWRNWVTLAARAILGIVLIVSGARKATNLTMSGTSTWAYQILSYQASVVVGHILPFAEIGLGLVLVAGLFTRVAGGLGALLMLGFIIAIASVWIRGISIDCGCFGQGGPVSPETALRQYPWEIARDTGLLLCGLWLVIFGKPFYAVDNWLFAPLDQIAARQGKRR